MCSLHTGNQLCAVLIHHTVFDKWLEYFNYLVFCYFRGLSGVSSGPTAPNGSHEAWGLPAPSEPKF